MNDFFVGVGIGTLITIAGWMIFDIVKSTIEYNIREGIRDEMRKQKN